MSELQLLWTIEGARIPLPKIQRRFEHLHVIDDWFRSSDGDLRIRRGFIDRRKDRRLLAARWPVN